LYFQGNMKELILFSFLVLFNLGVFSQPHYNVTWGTTSYDTLTNFTSIPNDVLMSPIISYQETDVSFGFNFPFFDSLYSSITINGDGFAYFPDGTDYNFFLFTGEFENHLFSGQPIYSDWRYKNEIVAGVNVLKVEWRNVGILDDVFDVNPTYHYINFQTWFYENGTIDIHFGDIDLMNTPYYSTDSGFIWSSGETYGPWIGIVNQDESEVYFISGTNNNVTVAFDDNTSDIYYDIPVSGMYFRFTPNGIVGIKSKNKEINTGCNIFPNPASGKIFIQSAPTVTARNTQLVIYDITGKKVLEKQFISASSLSPFEIDVASLENGTYLLHVMNDETRFVRKMVISR
jgi:hypothetical protein